MISEQMLKKFLNLPRPEATTSWEYSYLYALCNDAICALQQKEKAASSWQSNYQKLKARFEKHIEQGNGEITFSEFKIKDIENR